MQAGAGPAWYLLDTSQAIKPLIWSGPQPLYLQGADPSRRRQRLQQQHLRPWRPGCRVNAGYGLWQLAFGSRAALTAANHAAFADGDARSLLNTEIAPGGAASNVWKNTAERIVTARRRLRRQPWLP